MTVVVTSTKITGVKDYNDGPYKCRIRDITFDTGTYVTGGNVITAASVGLRTIDLVRFGTQAMTGGSSRGDCQLDRRDVRVEPAVGDVPAVRVRRDGPPRAGEDVG
jgi:hypothetical protein